jgi:hypothetical protein
MFDKQLESGVMVVTHNYRIPGWKDKEIGTFYINDEWDKEHSIFLYRK